MAKRGARRSPKATASRKKSKTGRKVSGRAAAGAKASTLSKSGTRGAKKAGVGKIVRKTAKPKTTRRSGTGKTAKVAARAAKTRPTPIKKASPKRTAVAKSAAKTRAKKVAAAPPVKVAPVAQARPKPSRPKHAPKDPRPIVQSPPSSLDMVRRGTAARTGRAEIAESRADHATMTPSITGGDVDASVEDAYFTGDEAPGGDNTTPDQDIVDDIGKALGVEYQDNEELRGSDKVADRDKHRWELDPASAEDYRDRK